MFIVYSVKMIIELRTVSGFKGAYRLQYHDYLPKAFTVCFVGSLTHTINFTLRFKLSGKARH